MDKVYLEDLKRLYNEAYYADSSKDGKEFCRNNPILDYDKAIEYEERENDKRFDALCHKRAKAYLELTGESDIKDIPAEILNKIHKQALADFTPWHEGINFWIAICEQIQNEIDEVEAEDE